MLETASEVRSTSDTAALASPTTALAYLFIVLFVSAAAIGVGLACIGFGFSAKPVTSDGRWPAKNHSGWSRPLLCDLAELAALEQRQLEAARARRGWRPISRALSSRFDERTHRRLAPPPEARLPADIIAPAHGECPSVSIQPTTSAPERRSILGLALPQRNASDHPQQLAYIFSLPSHARDSLRSAQDDAVALAAERAFDSHLLEKSMLAEAKEAELALKGNPSYLQPLNCKEPGAPATKSMPGNSDGWEWVDSFCPCPVGDEMPSHDHDHCHNSHSTVTVTVQLASPPCNKTCPPPTLQWQQPVRRPAPGRPAAVSAHNKT